MKKISYYDATARNKRTGKTEDVMVVVKDNYKGEYYQERLCPITSIDNPEDIEDLKKETNPTNYVILRAEPRYVQEEQEEIDWEEEHKKCVESPYYFATKYMTVKWAGKNPVPFVTTMTEEAFNEYHKQFIKSKYETSKLK